MSDQVFSPPLLSSHDIRFCCAWPYTLYLAVLGGISSFFFTAAAIAAATTTTTAGTAVLLFSPIPLRHLVGFRNTWHPSNTSTRRGRRYCQTFTTQKVNPTHFPAEKAPLHYPLLLLLLCELALPLWVALLARTLLLLLLLLLLALPLLLPPPP